jgi:uncharacterized protein with NRDE domain
MCLILFSYKAHPDYELILAANRDEFYNRPTASLDYWTDHPDVLAGRDLKGNGTWLGITRTGRIAAITNFREPAATMENAPSRGILIRNFLTGNSLPQRYLKEVSKIGHTYNGFNLIAGDATGLYYYSNRATRVQQLKPGFYGISNHLLDTAWPKIQRGKALLQRQLNGREKIDIEKIWEILADRSRPPDKALPDTGVGLQRERILSSLFISSPDYGTRSSSIILMEKSGQIAVMERTFLNTANATEEGETVKYSFKVERLSE